MAVLAPEARATRAGPPRDRRRRLRRVLFLLGLVPLFLSLLLVLKVATMLHFNSSARDAYGQERFTGAAAAFSTTLLGNVLEPWVAPYDLGTTRYRQGAYAGARDQLEDALALVPPGEECRVRTNLALAEEALGDAALADGDVTGARTEWTAARAVLEAGGCAETAPEARDRLVQKLTASPSSDAAHKAQPPPEAADSVEERNQRAEQRRRNEEQRREDRAATPNPPPQDPDDPDAPTPQYEW